MAMHYVALSVAFRAEPSVPADVIAGGTGTSTVEIWAAVMFFRMSELG